MPAVGSPGAYRELRRGSASSSAPSHSTALPGRPFPPPPPPRSPPGPSRAPSPPPPPRRRGRHVHLPPADGAQQSTTPGAGGPRLAIPDRDVGAPRALTPPAPFEGVP